MTNRQWEVPHVLQTSTPLLPRIGHTSTLLANGLMIVLGGLVAPGNDTLGTGNSSLSAPSMSNVLVFNTQSLSWTNVTAGGVVPSPRRGHSALLGWYLYIIFLLRRREKREEGVEMLTIPKE